MFFWVQCRFVGRCQRFGEKYCFHLQGLRGDAGKYRDYIRLEGVVCYCQTKYLVSVTLQCNLYQNPISLKNKAAYPLRTARLGCTIGADLKVTLNLQF
jgi:hypothetical protein